MNIFLTKSSRGPIIRIKDLRKLTRSGIEFAAYTSGKGLVRATSVEILRKPKSGRVYIRTDRIGRSRRHVASSAGETHANLTGALRTSLGFKVNVRKLEFGYGVQSQAAPSYAGAVEFGSNRSASRPSLRNGIKNERRNFQNNFSREIGKRLEGRGGLFR